MKVIIDVFHEYINNLVLQSGTSSSQIFRTIVSNFSDSSHELLSYAL